MSPPSVVAHVRFRLPPIVLAALVLGGCMEQGPIAPADIGPAQLSHTIFGGLTSNAYGGAGPAWEASFTPPVVGTLAGEVVYVGQGCTAGGGVAVDDPYLANPAGRIALIDRGTCLFDNKVARAQLAGAIGVIVFNAPAGSTGGEQVILMGGNNPVTGGAPSLIGTAINIPAIFIGHTNGVLLRDGPAPVTVVYTPPPPPTAAQLLDHVYNGLDQVLAAGLVNEKDAKTLRNHLDAAAKEIAKGQMKSAANKINDFIRAVTSFEAKGVLTPAAADFLRNLAGTVLPAL